MHKTENWNYEFFEDLVERGLVSTSNAWIKKAIEQRHNNLSLAIANSRLLVYDKFDRNILTLTSLN
jgi:hypothetical protein